ncbi:MAG TPA: hypothetical protein VGL81_30605 [Polyangiaceae bacterium]
MTGPAFEVLDALEGFASLVKRSPTLDGAVPVRVAQGCVPLLEGNALGFQVVLQPGLHVRRRLGRVLVEADAELDERLARGRSAALPRLVAHGLLRAGGAWEKRLRRSTAWIEKGHVRVWTGLLVRPSPGIWLRVSGAANRRSVALDLAEVFIGDDAELVPLVLDVTLRGDEAHLRGEVACLTPLRPGVAVRQTTLAELPALGRAHAAFYDAAYFAAKKGDTTKKYRRLVAREKGPREGTPVARAEVARVGPLQATVASVDRFLDAEATSPRARRDDGRSLEVVTFANTVAFRATYDGLTMTIDHDARALAAAASEVESTWGAVFGAPAVQRDRRALWYLTKYFTPHPPGEPHFFVKPFAFTQTPPGWSSIVAGVPGDGYDVLSGVVSTDTFFATPAVFAVHRVGAPIRVPAGAPLVRVIPVPRDLLGATWRSVRFRDEPARAAP